MPTPSPDWGLESLQSEGWSWAEPFRIRGLLSQAISCTSFTYLEEALHLPSIPSLTLLTLYEWWQGGKDSPCQSKRHKRHGFDPWVRKIPWRRKWQHNPLYWKWIMYSCLENSMDTGAWQATVHGVTKSRTRLSTDTRIAIVAHFALWTHGRLSRVSISHFVAGGSTFLFHEKERWCAVEHDLFSLGCF